MCFGKTYNIGVIIWGEKSMCKKNNIMGAFIFDSGCLGEWYGEKVFRMILCGKELLKNRKKIVVSWGDILTSKRYVDLEPYILKDEYCTIDLSELEPYRFTDYPYCWVMEDIDKDIADSIDKRLKETVIGYMGFTRIDKSNVFKQKQFWKDMIRSITILKKTITCFQDPKLVGAFPYIETATELGYKVKYDPVAEYCAVEDLPILQSSFIVSDEDLEKKPSKYADIDRDIWTMNFALRQEMQISGVLLWRAVYDIDKIHFYEEEKDNASLIEYPFLTLYHAAQGIERMQKAIIELICKKNHIAEAEKEIVYKILYKHSHDRLHSWIEEKEKTSVTQNGRKLLDILTRFYNTVRYARYGDESIGGNLPTEYTLLLELKNKRTQSLNGEIKNNFGNYLGEVANSYYKLYCKLCDELGIFAYELECDSDAGIVYYHQDKSKNLYQEFLHRKQAKRELIYWLITQGKNYPKVKYVKEPALKFDSALIEEYITELIENPESTQYLFDAVDSLYDELCSENKEQWRERIELIEYIIGKS